MPAALPHQQSWLNDAAFSDWCALLWPLLQVQATVDLDGVPESLLFGWPWTVTLPEDLDMLSDDDQEEDAAAAEQEATAGEGDFGGMREDDSSMGAPPACNLPWAIIDCRWAKLRAPALLALQRTNGSMQQCRRGLSGLLRLSCSSFS